MQPPRRNERINLAELKAEMVKKLGPERSKQYFFYFSIFLSLKVSKGEFDRLCIKILGRENIPLHNQFIRSILRNACTQKSPPLASQEGDVFKHGAQVGGNDISADVYQNGSHVSITQASGSPCLPNGGDKLPISPRKSRSGYCKTVECCSALGPNVKTSFPSQLSTSIQSDEYSIMFENGDSNPHQLERSVQHHHQGIMQQPEDLNDISVSCPAKLSGLRKPSDNPSPVHRKDHMEIVIRDDGKHVSTSIPLHVPLWVPFCPVSVGGACRSLPQASSNRCIGTFIDGVLLDSLSLREQMEQIAVEQGLERVSVDCANILNHGLDYYLKRLIVSCIELVGSRSVHELTRSDAHKLHIRMKPINGVRSGHQYQMLSSGHPF